jgi:hypothetical protein
MPGMEPNRFDDVDTRIVEEPVEARAPRKAPGRIGPAILAIVAALSLTGSLAAGASALTSTAQAPTRTVMKTEQIAREHHGLCHKGDRGTSAPTALSY